MTTTQLVPTRERQLPIRLVPGALTGAIFKRRHSNSPETANFVKFHTKGHRALAHYEYRFHGDERPAYTQSENRDFLYSSVFTKNNIERES